MIAYLYSITNTVTGKKYFGVTTDPEKRKQEHYSSRSKGSLLVGRAMEKHQKDNFLFEILLCGESKEMYKMEPIYIEENNSLAPNGYNIAEGGKGGKTGPISSETRKKMSISHTGKPRSKHTDETRKKQSLAAMGRMATAATKQKMSTSKKGQNNPMYGRTHSEETKNKISLSKIGNEGHNKGIPRTEETKRKISETCRLKRIAKLNLQS